LELDDVRTRAIDVGVGQGKPLVVLTPGFDVGLEVELGLFRYPLGLFKSRHEFAGAPNELSRITDPVASTVAVPASRHTLTLPQSPEPG
jgi:hypothetical protein